ncbi:TonB-dependent receptor [Sphingomonas oligophenolica]|uniref:TonB-dependent receptor n=1 Tax=Sphingomonas oligophenolica TaxID=301154 RepID=A0A502BZR2_9SPHN|nr:TonB-dependent receptor [Sphingomonas oligophenolica]
MSAAPAVARDARFRIDVPAGDLTDALATLSSQTGASIGIAVHSRGIESSAVRGRHSVADALAMMLATTPFAAERIGPTIWRLIPRQPPIDRDAPSIRPLADIIVTARKIPEALSRIATPIAVYVPRAVARARGSTGIHDVAATIEGLSVTNLGPGRDRPFIRGIADSPFNGFSQSTVSVNIDDARVTYDAPEPGLRLVDIARVEVLKGPQGPLYGTGALGGVYRIVTNRPVPGSFDSVATMGFEQIADGGVGADASGMINVPVFAARAALRFVGYVHAESGWVKNATATDKVNDTRILGARAAFRIIPATGWTVDVGATRQRIDVRDSQYVDIDADDLTRSNRLPEPSSTKFSLVSATVAGPIGAQRLTLATSHAWQDSSETYDLTPMASALGFASGRTYVDSRRHRVFDQEVRVESAEGHHFAWTAGASYLAATTVAVGTLRDENRRALPFSFALHRAATEAALFADGSLEILPRMRAGLGGRLFRATTNDERREEIDVAVTARARIGITPSASLTYSLAEDRIVYIRFGTAFRPGGLDPTNITTARYDSDEIRSIDVGSRVSLDRGRLSLSGGGFRSSWFNVQSDYLLEDGLVGTRNAGDALIVGFEGAVEWRPGDWSLRAWATAQRARLEKAPEGVDLPADRRLPIVPDLSAKLEVDRTVTIADRRITFTLGGAYRGHSRLSFDPGLDRAMGGYAIFHADAFTTVEGLGVHLGVSNLSNNRADSFAFGNPFRIRTERQYTPLQPRTINLSLASHF